MVVPVAVPAGVDDPGAMTSPGDGDTDAHVPPSFDEVATELVRGLAPVIVSEMDSDGRTTAISGALLDRLGYPEEWFLGKTVSDISDDSTTRDVVDRVLAGEEVRTTVSLNGRPWLVWMRPVRAADGTVEGAVSVLTYADDCRAQRELSRPGGPEPSSSARSSSSSSDFIAIADLDAPHHLPQPCGPRAGRARPSRTRSSGRPTDDYFADRRPCADPRRGGQVRDRRLTGRGSAACATSAPVRPSRSPSRLVPGHPVLRRARRWRSPRCSATCAPSRRPSG